MTIKHRASNHEGCYIYDKKSSRWIFQQRYIDTSTGKSCRKAFSSASRADLKKKVTIWQKDLDDGKAVSGKRYTVKDWGEKWLSLIKPSLKVKTYDGYVQTLKAYIYPGLGEIQLNRLTMFMVQEHLNNLLKHLSATTVTGVRRRLITMLGMAEGQGLIKSNVARLTRPPHKEHPKITILTEEEIRRLITLAKEGKYIYYGVKEIHEPTEEIKYLQKNYYVAISLAVASSCRIGELFALTWDNVDFKNNKITIEKSLSETASGNHIGDPKTLTSNRTIAIPLEYTKLLKNWQKEQGKYAKKWQGLYNNEHNLLFTNSCGKPVSLTNFYRRWWTKLTKAADLPEGFTFHGIRHTGASLLLKNNVNIKVVSERLGHSSTSVTANIYQHCLPDMQDKAVAEIRNILYPKKRRKG